MGYSFSTPCKSVKAQNEMVAFLEEHYRPWAEVIAPFREELFPQRDPADPKSGVTRRLMPFVALDENENHGSAVPAIRTLQNQRDDARSMVVAARGVLQQAIDQGAVRPSIMFGKGKPVLLCSVCLAILNSIGDSEHPRAKICPKGQGCGEWDDG